MYGTEDGARVSRSDVMRYDDDVHFFPYGIDKVFSLIDSELSL